MNERSSRTNNVVLWICIWLVMGSLFFQYRTIGYIGDRCDLLQQQVTYLERQTEKVGYWNPQGLQKRVEELEQKVRNADVIREAQLNSAIKHDERIKKLEQEKKP